MNFADLKKKIVSFVADIRIYNFGLILWGNSYYQIKGHHQREILGTLEDGDVLLRRYNAYLGSIAIPGYWSHAAHYVGDNFVIHMLGKGIAREDILTFMRCDDVAILRHKDAEKIPKAIEETKTQFNKGTEYDYNFDAKRPDKLYCTELIDFAFGKLNYTREIKKYLLPDDMLAARELELLWAKNMDKWKT